MMEISDYQNSFLEPSQKRGIETGKAEWDMAIGT